MAFRYCFFLLILILYHSCHPKGPVIFDNPLVGKTKSELTHIKGAPNKIKTFGENFAYIYTKKEAYYGKTKNIANKNPKHIYIIEYIYYINASNKVYKYQVWKRKIKD